MLLTISAFIVMAMGLIVHERARQLAAEAQYATIALFEAERAAEFGLLISILTAPWLLIASIWRHS